MFELSENNRYFFFPEPVRMSYGIDGLSKLVYAHPALSLVSGDIFVFFSLNNIYFINSQVAWTTYGNKKEYSKFNANVLISKSEQEYRIKANKFKQIEEC